MEYDNTLFLLGGHDLEMLTIKAHLEKKGVPYVDKDLEWGASLSSYQEEILQAEREGKEIYAIELGEDIGIPRKYHRIDHHNERREEPSSLEQVLTILGIEPSRYDQLVAANDRDYIPGMKALNATQEEIDEIRRADREAQGVTAEDEQKALEEIKDPEHITTNHFGVTLVKTTCRKFSPICDALYPYKTLIIYNDDEAVFYGNKTNSIKEKLMTWVGENAIYFGKGYVGIKKDVLDKDTLERNVNNIRNSIVQSYHVFYFPFTWELKDEDKTFTEMTNLDQIHPNTSKWERVTSNKTEEDEEDRFNEEQYFFKVVHDVIYDVIDDKGKSSDLIRHYEWKKSDAEMKYVITVGKNEQYTLDIDTINLNLYCTGVGVLTFYLQNSEASQFDERVIRRINQYGRRIMPPNNGEYNPGGRITLAQEIALTGLGDDERYKDNFVKNKDSKSWKPADFITNLIKDLDKEITVFPIIDDRMLVNCWYTNEGLSKQIRNSMYFQESDLWYKHVFVDEGNDSTCQNDEMRMDLLKKSTYPRWQKYGTLFGVSRYSIVCIAGENGFSVNCLARHMKTLYARLFELAIVQQASMLRFSQEVTKVSKNFQSGEKGKYNIQHIESLHREYLKFINRIFFLDVTAQDQGIELYDIMKEQFKLKERETDLENEIGKLYEYAMMKEEKNSADNSWKLNLLAALIIPATLVLGFFSMNDVSGLNTCWQKIVSGSITILTLVVYVILLLYIRHKK